jgi:hypothetical protein
VSCLGENRFGIRRQPAVGQKRFQLPDLSLVVQIDSKGQNLLLLLVAGEDGLEPEDCLRKAHRPDSLDSQFRSGRE